jgi:hypothetical protein
MEIAIQDHKAFKNHLFEIINRLNVIMRSECICHLLLLQLLIFFSGRLLLSFVGCFQFYSVSKRSDHIKWPLLFLFFLPKLNVKQFENENEN